MGGESINKQVGTRNGASVIRLPEASDRLLAGQSNRTSSPAEVLQIHSDLGGDFPIAEDELSTIESFLSLLVEELMQVTDKTPKIGASSKKSR